MTQTLEAAPQVHTSPLDMERMVYGTDLSAYERAPYVAAHDLMVAAQKANELSREADMLSGETRARLLDRANFTLEYAALCAALPVHQKVRKERPSSNNPNLARAWVPYPNKVVPVDVFPVAVMDVLHDQALYDHEEHRKRASIEVDVHESTVNEDMVSGEEAPVIDVAPEQAQPRRRGLTRALGWLGLNHWIRKR